MPSTQTIANCDTFDLSEPSVLAPICDSLSALLTAMEPHEPNAPAARAYRAAIRARGQEVGTAGGYEALSNLMAMVTATKPDRAEVREAILDHAWTGLPGWHAEGVTP